MAEDKPDEPRRIKIAAVGDIHYSTSGNHPLEDVAALAEGSDVLLLCGDLTDHGLPEEAKGLASELARVHVPIVAVLGNHDYESGRTDEIGQILTEAGVTVLDGDACVVAGLGFAGAKGFGGGFGRATLAPWGEPAIKAFVQAAVEEALKLESALARLQTPTAVAIMHYAPIRETLEGEPAELLPFLGCSRLEEPLNRRPVAAVFHGHAHHGAPEGRTANGVPVFNVSLPILRREYPDGPPVRRWQVEVRDE